MNTTTKLLLSSKNNIPINTQLAVEIGLNETIVLRQVYYWVEHYETEKKNFIDGKYWVYNSMKQWRSDNFPFMSEKTIERAFSSLRKKNLILVGDYSQDRMKRPNWYTINDKEFDKLIKKITGIDDNSGKQEEENKETDKENDTNSPNAVRQNDCMQSDTPTDCYNIYNNINTDTENTNIDYSTENTDKYTLEDVKRPSSKGNIYTSVPEEHKDVSPKKQSRYIPPDYTEEQLIEHIRPTIEDNLKTVMEDCGIEYNPDMADTLVEVVRDFYAQYHEAMGHRHRILPDATLINVMYNFFDPPEELFDAPYDVDMYATLAEGYFSAKFDTEYTPSFSHFMGKRMRAILYHRTK